MQIIDLSQLKSVITVKSGGFDLFYYNGDKPIRRSLFRVDEKSCLLPLPASGNKLIIIAVPLPETEVEDKNYAEVDQTNVAVHLDQYQRFFEKHKLPKLEKLPKKIDALTTAKFSAAIRQRLSKQLEIETKLDLNNIQHKLDENKSSLHDAGGRVAGILGKIKLSKLTRNLDTTLHPILRAMQILANHEHCEVEFEGVEVADYDTYYDCLLSVANRSHLAIRRVALELGWWQTCSQAMIAFDKEDGNPYVVVPEGVSKVYVINPVTLERELLTAEIANRFGYNALALHAVYPKRKLDWRDILRLTLSSSKHHLILLLFVSLIAAVMGMLPPILTGQLIGQIIPKNEVDYLIQIPIILISSGISIALFGLVKQLLIISIESQATQHNQAALFHRILYLPMQFFRKYTVGDLANRAFAFENISKTITGANINGFLTIAYSFFSFFLMLYYAWQLALIVCVVMIIVIALLLYFTRIEMILTLKSAEADANSSALAYQILYGINKFKISAKEAVAYSRWFKLFSGLLHVKYRGLYYYNWLKVVVKSNKVILLILIYAVFGTVLKNKVDLASFTAFNAAFTQYTAALLGIQGIVESLLKSKIYYQRGTPILETLPETAVHPERGSSVTFDLTGHLEMSHIVFGYSEAEPPVINDVSIVAYPGEFIAIVGSSGSGKSTLLRLLLGFEQPDRGSILFDDFDSEELDKAELRRQFGVVLQNGQLMLGSIKDNITCGKIGFSDDDIWDALKKAGVADDVAAMPMTLNTLIAEGFGGISGGQKQRLLIARALIHKPKILLFDEATSAMDNKTQKIVNDHISQLDVTRIVVAHRLSTIRDADRIYVMDKGKIIESGSYDELVAQKGLFHKLAMRQIA